MSEVIIPRAPLPERFLRTLRFPASRRIRRKWDVHERGVAYVPSTGPVILASNHVGWLDGPLLVALSPRPVHALVKSEEFEQPRTARLLRSTGQMRVRREGVDAGAIRQAVGALHHEQAVLMFPEGHRGAGDVESIHRGIGYLAMVTGAPVVPVAVFGTRTEDEDLDSRPPKGRRIEVHYGRSFWFAPVDPPRRRADIAAATEEIHRRLRDHVDAARQSSEVGLPFAASGSDG